MSLSMTVNKGHCNATTKSDTSRMLNPWVLHLQKLGLELKCPLCLNFFARPMLLPCNHIFCHDCLSKSSEFAVACSLCLAPYSCEDIRSAPYMENIVLIYRSLDATFHSNLSQNVPSDLGRALEQCTVAHNREATKESIRTTQDGKRQVKETDKFGAEMKGHSGFENSNLGLLDFRFRNPEAADGRIADIDINHVDSSSLGSPPSLSDPKCLDDDSSDHNSEHVLNFQSPANHSSKRPVQELCDNNMSSKRSDGFTLKSAALAREFKRQKQLIDDTPFQMCMESNFKSNSSAEPNSLVSWTSKRELESDPLTQCEDEHHVNNFVCGFCLSSTSSEATGEMLHYSRGNPVEGYEAANPNVIHVHRRCIEWAPQVYFVGETVRNLEKELARGAKLKCFKCGLKGAALGCYAKSCRRTYHAPCASNVSKCRWDCDNFLILCPTHASLRFPNEKSKRSSKLPSAPNHKVSESQQSQSWRGSSAGSNKWVLCGSALSADDKFLLIRFASKIGATVSKFWTPDVTHVVAATNDDGACTRTFKVLMAILHGRWVLKIDWIKACMEAMKPVDEEPYEICLDNHGCCSGSRLGRLRVTNNDPKLFSGMKFYFAGDFVPGFAKDLENLIVAAGGDILPSTESLMQAQDEMKGSTTYIVYNPEAPEGCQLGEEISIYWQKLNEAEELAASSGAEIINHTWVLESIAACKLQPSINLTKPLV